MNTVNIIVFKGLDFLIFSVCGLVSRRQKNWISAFPFPYDTAPVLLCDVLKDYWTIGLVVVVQTLQRVSCRI